MVQGAHGPAKIILPRHPRLKDGWRAAAAAYRKAYGEHTDPHRGPANEAYNAAEAALKAAVPGISDEEASREAVSAVHYASVMHPKWLYALHKPRPSRDG